MVDKRRSNCGYIQSVLDVNREILMKTSDIKNLGNAYRSIYEAKVDDKEFKPHMMYDPETGEAHKAEKPEDHERMKKMGYTHEKPEGLDEAGRFSAAGRADSLEKKADKIEKKFGDKERIRVAKDRIRGAKAKHKAGIASRKAAKKPSVSSTPKPAAEPEATTENAVTVVNKGKKLIGLGTAATAAGAAGATGYAAGKKSNNRKVTVVHKSKVKKEEAEVNEFIGTAAKTLGLGAVGGAAAGAAKNLNDKRKEKNLIKKARAYNDLHYGEDKEVEENVGGIRNIVKGATRHVDPSGIVTDKGIDILKKAGQKTASAGKKTAKAAAGGTAAVVGYNAVKETKLPRQMLDPKKDVMVVKNNKVIVIDKSKEAEYLKKGWGLAEQVDEAVKLGKGPSGSKLKFGKRLEVGDTVYCISNGEEGKITKIIGKHDRDSGNFEVKLKKSGKVMKKSLDQLSHDNKMDDVYEEVSPVMSPTQELNELKQTVSKVIKPVIDLVKKGDEKAMALAKKYNKGDAYTKGKEKYVKQMKPAHFAADVSRNVLIATPVYGVVQAKKKAAEKKAKETADKVADFGDDITKGVKARINTMKPSTKKEAVGNGIAGGLLKKVGDGDAKAGVKKIWDNPANMNRHVYNLNKKYNPVAKKVLNQSVSEGKRGAVAGGIAGGLAGQKLGGGVARIAGGAALGAIAGDMTQNELRKRKVAKKAAELRKLTKKESTEMTEGDVKDLAMKIDKIVAKMNKDSKLKPFAKKFASMAMDTMDIEKSLEKALPSSVSGAKIIGLLEKKQNEALDAVDDKEVDKKFKDRKDKDIDNDGDVDSSDEYLHNRRAKVDDAIDAKKKEKKDTPEISKIGEEFVNFLESALTHEPMDSKESPKGKEFIGKHKKSDKDLEDKEKEAEEQTPKAGKVTKEKSGKRSIDSPVGDKNIVKSTEAPIKEGLEGSLAGTVAGAYAGKKIDPKLAVAGAVAGGILGNAAQNALNKKINSMPGDPRSASRIAKDKKKEAKAKAKSLKAESSNNVEEGLLGGLAGFGLGSAAARKAKLGTGFAGGLAGAVVGSAAQNALKKKAAAVGQRPVIIRQQVENESVSLVDQARAHLAGEKNPELFGKPPAPKKATNPYDARTKEAKKFMQRMDKRRGVKRD